MARRGGRWGFTLLFLAALAAYSAPASAAGSPPAQEIIARYVRGLTSEDLGPFFAFHMLYRAAEAQVRQQYPQALWSQQIGRLQDEVRRDLLQRRSALAFKSTAMLGAVDSSLFLFQPKARATILEIRGPSKVSLDLRDTLGRLVADIPYHTAFVKAEYPDAGVAPIVLLQPDLLQMSDKKRLKEVVLLLSVVFFPSDPDLSRAGLSGPIVYSMSSTLGGIASQGSWRPGPPLVEAVLSDTAQFWPSSGEQTRSPSPGATTPLPPSPRHSMAAQPSPAHPTPRSELPITARADEVLRQVAPPSADTVRALHDREAARVLALGPGMARTIAALAQQGVQAMRAKDWGTCIEIFGRVLGYDPENFQALGNQAGCLYERGILDRAIERALRAIQKIPDPALYFVVASSYVKLGDKTRALAWLAAAVKGGFKDLQMIQENFAPLRDDPEYLAIIAPIR